MSVEQLNRAVREMVGEWPLNDEREIEGGIVVGLLADAFRGAGVFKRDFTIRHPADEGLDIPYLWAQTIAREYAARLRDAADRMGRAFV